jgi:hypothetical protein
MINPLNAELNPICHFLALLGAHPIIHVSRIRVNLPSCGWSEEFPRSCPEDGGSVFFQNNGRLYNITVEETVIFIDTNTVCKFKILNLFILTMKYTSTSTVSSS